MALVVVVRFVCALLVVGLLVLILWIFGALVERVLTLRPVEVTGLFLEGLVVALRETLVVLVVTFVGMIVTAMVIVVATNVFLVVISMMQVALLVAAIVASVALIHEFANIVVIALHHFVAEFAIGTKLNLLLTLLCEQAVSHLQVVDVVEILEDGLEGFIAEALSTLEVPVVVLLMKQHVETLNFECVVGRGRFPRRKGFG